jgi:ABC-type oligopeptide transport system ATPase subunit
MGQIASSKQTGLGGITYEDKVNAYFLACLLSETPPFNKDHGLIEKIKFQVRADGWMFDDALLFLRALGNDKRIAISVKSGQQFTTNGIPAELNRLLWQQYLHDENEVFNPDTDSLCLIEPRSSANISTDLNTLLSLAYLQEPGDLYRRKNAEGFISEAKKKIYTSFECPTDLAGKYNILPQQTDSLLKHFLHQQMDFEDANSFSEKITIDLCRKILKDKHIDKAIRLFDRLCILPREQAPNSGYIDIVKLIQLLRSQFQLEDIPSYAEDWEKLESYSKSKLEVILDKIGNKISFYRSNILEEIEKGFKENMALILHGISGSGKTVIAKNLAEKKKESGKVIWFDSSDFSVHNLESSLRLSNSFPELIKDVNTKEAYFILDGVEKLYTSDQQARFAVLLSNILNQPFSAWKILLTCPSDSLSWVFEMLHRNNLNSEQFFQVAIQNLNDDEINKLTDTYPRVAPFLYNDKLQALLNNLKLLDKLIFNIDSIAITEGQYLGETELIDFIWNEEVQKSKNGIQKGAFIKMLAEKQADTLAFTISDAEFSIAEMGPADDLVSSHFIKHQNGRFSFTHDLYGDWARYKLLVSMPEKLFSFLELKHLSSPLWIKAFRYYGISLLEKERDNDKWTDSFLQLNDKISYNIILRDLLLEALFFSNNALQYLERYKSFLFESNGEHFIRLITLFQSRATTSNPAILEIAKEIGLSEVSAASIDRLPIWNYWPDIIRFIHSNLNQVIMLDPVGASKLAHTWLKHTPSYFFLRKEASDIAISVANEIISEKKYFKEEIEKSMYESLILAFNENPEEIKKLCLTICKRIKTEQEKIEKNIDYPELLSNPAQVKLMDKLSIPKRERVIWEDGPYERISSTFQTVCLETRSLFPIMHSDPGLVTEIMLAVLIDPPKERYFGRSYDDDLSIYQPSGWHPPFFNRGPFLKYFRINAFEALKFTLKIVDFATERKLEEDKHAGVSTEGITVEFEGQKKMYKGDQIVFSWYKDIGRAPHSLVSLLMAFEQFLYEEIEKEKPIAEFVRFGIKNTNSLAIVGLLLVVAKIQPKLFNTELRHLLGVYEFYLWDLNTDSPDRSIFWSDLPKTWHSQAEIWRNRKHRFFPLKDVIINHWLFDKDLQHAYESFVLQWEQRLEKMNEEGRPDIYLMQIIPQFQMQNWEFKQKDTELQVQYNEPKNVTDYLKSGRESSLEIMYDGSFAFRCDQLMKEKDSITLQDAEGIWNKLQKYLSDLNPKDGDSDGDLDGWGSPYTNIMAAMASLLYFKNSWIDSHPEYYLFIREFSTALMETEIKKDKRFDEPGTNHDWNIFLAIIASKLWIDNEMDSRCRILVAGVALQFTNETVEKLFSEISKFIEWSDSRFIQLQNLILRFSAEYHKFVSNRHSGKISFQPTKEKILKEFKDDIISRETQDWSKVRNPKKRKAKGKRYQTPSVSDNDYIRDPGLNTSVLKHVFKTLPELDKMRSPAERSHILFLFRQGINQVVYQLGEIKESSKPIDDFPDEFNLYLVQRVPSILALLNHDENPDTYWRPILKYGYIAPRWVDSFCTHFFLFNIQKSERQDNMVTLLGRMVEFSQTSPTWQLKNIGRSEDFRLCVLGMQPRLVSIWDDDFSVFMEKAKKIYQLWFLKNKFNPFAVSALLDFIVTRSADYIIKDALTVFKAFFGLSQYYTQATPVNGFVSMVSPDHDYKLSNALNYLLKNKKHVFKSDKLSFKIFRDLVQYLVAQKNTVAIELQNELMMEK